MRSWFVSIWTQDQPAGWWPWVSHCDSRNASWVFFFSFIISCSGKYTEFTILILQLSSEGSWKNKIIKIMALQWYWELTHLWTSHPLNPPCNSPSHFSPVSKKQKPDSGCIYSCVNPEPPFQFQHIYPLSTQLQMPSLWSQSQIQNIFRHFWKQVQQTSVSSSRQIKSHALQKVFSYVREVIAKL